MKILNIIFGKISLLIISSLYLIFLWWCASVWQPCIMFGSCGRYSDINVHIILSVGAPLIGVFIMTLITSMMDERVFKAWRLFALFAVPTFSYWMYQDLFAPHNSISGKLIGLGVMLNNILFVSLSILVIALRWAGLKDKPSHKTATKTKR